ncbi:hypothetical protein MIND_00074400 [Mycena indigotica]|uniref:Uncharacterized protein n=1 Tax=Mycena indigotica TaxID=2126181 RepID=A0A8H6TB92_9AGAR|nr:uncharacterized protein MIND_00074400 [Mycena indigotica]KAF7315590.1 hypothetical protein MIND_00074400 [Mycena indigotica]
MLSHAEPMSLPTELFSLHALLTNDPIPGKSLHAMLAGSHARPQPSPLHKSVETVIHSAFWDVAREQLRGDPVAQLERSKSLLLDVYEAIEPLLRPNDPVLSELRRIPPTTSLLHSVKLILKDVLLSLRKRAAPVRDPSIDKLLDNLETSANDLETTIVDTSKSLLSLAEIMKSDLTDFVVGSMTDSELRTYLTQRAHQNERKAILNVWDKSAIDEIWRAWVGELEVGHSFSPREAWIRRLMQSLRSTIPVSCPLPDSAEVSGVNTLPPPFLFSQPQLLRMQNYLQALVVATSLRSLVHIPSGNDAGAFIARVWVLLEAEIDEKDSVGTTKLINLADEVIRARRLVSAVDEAEESRLREAVDRTLRYSDPVFKLLQKRLLDALAQELCHDTITSLSAPSRMQTGRSLGASEGSLPLQQPPLFVKGFEDPVIANAIRKTSDRIRRDIDWVQEMWFNV